MTREVRVGASATAIRDVLGDAGALGRILPGCEAIEATGPDRFRLVLSSRFGFMTVRADVDATIVDVDPPRSLRLELDGRTRGMEGGFRATIPFELVPLEDGSATLVRYAVEATTSGAADLVGPAAIESAVATLTDGLVGDLEHEANAGR